MSTPSTVKNICSKRISDRFTQPGELASIPTRQDLVFTAFHSCITYLGR